MKKEILKLKAIIAEKRSAKLQVDRIVGHVQHFPAYSKDSSIQNNIIRSAYRQTRQLNRFMSQKKASPLPFIQLTKKCNIFIRN